MNQATTIRQHTHSALFDLRRAKRAFGEAIEEHNLTTKETLCDATPFDNMILELENIEAGGLPEWILAE